MTKETAFPLSLETDAAGARLFLLKSAEEQIARALESRTRELSENPNLGADADRLVKHIASLTLSLARLTKLIEPPTDNPRCRTTRAPSYPSPPPDCFGEAPLPIGGEGEGVRGPRDALGDRDERASPRALTPHPYPASKGVSGEPESRPPPSRDLAQSAVPIDPRYSAERRAALGALRSG